MISRVVHLSAVIVALAGFIFIISALSTTEWITGCVRAKDLLGMIEKRDSQEDKTPAETDVHLISTESSICIQEGLFKITQTVEDIETSKSVDFVAMPRYVVFAIIILNLASVFCVVSMVMLISAISASYGEQKDQVTANRRTGKAVITMIVAGILNVVAMAEYCKETIEMVEERHKRDLGSTLRGTSLESFSNLINNNSVEMSMAYGYSFFFGWASVAIMIISIALASLSRSRKSPERQDNPSLL